MNFGPELKELVRTHTEGSLDPNVFQARMKSDHPLAMEYIARLLRRTTRHNGPVRDHQIDAWLRRDAVGEFESLLGRAPAAIEGRLAGGGLPSGDGMGNLRGGAVIGEAGGSILQTPHGREEIEQMFGQPNNRDGTLNEAWESENIRRIAPPSGWQLYYQDDDRGLVPMSSIRIHRKLEENFRSVLAAIWSHAAEEIGSGGSNDTIREWLHARRLDQYAGGFNYRVIHGTNRLSLHSYGIAIDWDADHNPQGHSSHTLPDWWYGIWQAHGWSDGRFFGIPDPMHVQFATGA